MQRVSREPHLASSHMSDLSSDFLDHVDADRAWAASRMALDLLEEQGVVALIRDLLVPVQRRSGDRWAEGTYSVADEHRVTGLVDELLGAAGIALPRPEEGAPVVTLACASGELHGSAGRMTSLQLRAQGIDVRFIGASAPVDEIERHLRESPPDALAVSCTMSATLVGAAAMVSAARRVGVPVLAGGQAFRRSPAAADLLGVDAVAHDAEAAAAVLRSWQQRGPVRHTPYAAVDPTGESALLGAHRAGLLQAVRDAIGTRLDRDDEIEVEVLLGTLEAAILVDDVELLSHHARWLRQRESVGPILPRPMHDVLAALRRSLPGNLPTSQRFVSEAAAHLEPA